jgi:ubiquinone/menaquinone biosynthesis C-methylase UbiE
LREPGFSIRDPDGIQANLPKPMTDIYKQNQNAYDQIVSEFARLNHTSLDGDLLTLAQKLALHVGQNGSILDIGCGTGRDMAFFESQGIAVSGLDLSAGMLAFARQKVKGGLALMNMCQIGFRKAFFDGVWSCASLLHVPKQAAPAVLQEMQRILKPGGMLILTIQEGNSESWDEGYVQSVKRFFARYAADEMKSMLANNGFGVRTVDLCHGNNNRVWLSFTCISE